MKNDCIDILERCSAFARLISNYHQSYQVINDKLEEMPFRYLLIIIVIVGLLYERRHKKRKIQPILNQISKMEKQEVIFFIKEIDPEKNLLLIPHPPESFAHKPPAIKESRRKLTQEDIQLIKEFANLMVNGFLKPFIKDTIARMIHEFLITQSAFRTISNRLMAEVAYAEEEKKLREAQGTDPPVH